MALLQSRFDYGAATLTLDLPPRPWTPMDETVGGVRVAAAGIPASYVVRRDALVEVTLRIWEDEWTDVANLIAWGQAGESITWYPDASDTGTSFEVWLQEPAPGTRCTPTRTDFPRVFEYSLTLRGVSMPPWVNYFP